MHAGISIERHYDGVSINRFRDIEILPIVIFFFFLKNYLHFLIFSSSNLSFIFCFVYLAGVALSIA
jgi:hypothetical protein